MTATRTKHSGDTAVARLRPKGDPRVAPATRRGAAMLLVLSVIAIAAVLGYAMLSMASMQRQIERNVRRGPEAEGLAESGVNLATYYLLNPQHAPGYAAMSNIDWHWPGTGGPVGFGGTPDGTVDVAVTHDPARPFEYDIVSTGAAAAGPVRRTVRARVYVNADYEIAHAAAFGTEAISVGTYTTLGALGEPTKVYARGALTIKTGGKVYGTVYKGLFSPASIAQPIGGSFQPLPAVPVFVPPDLAHVRSYLTYTLPNDPTVYHAQQHAGGLSLGGALGPSASNPAGVHVVTGDLVLLANAQVTGTLVVTGKLSLNLTASTVSVATLQPTLPALVVGGNIDFAPSLTGGTLNVTGVCWTGGKIDGAALNPATTNFNVTGAVLCDGTLFPTAPNVRVSVRHRPEFAKIRDFTDRGRTPKSVKVLEWRDGQ